MKKQTRACMAIAMAVAMTTATISSVVPGNGITAEAASVRLSKTSLTLKVGQSKQLTVKGTKKAVKWSVSNGKIVKVTKKGKVTAKKAGTAKVYAKVKGKKLTCKVKVTAASSKNATASSSISPTATATATASSQSSTGGSSSNSGSSSSSSKATSTPTATSGATITPTATNAADKTEVPTQTSKPEKTETPEGADTPEKTKGPKETEAPEKTKGPKETEAPEESDIPEKTKGPKETETPEETKEPVETDDPTSTDKPETGSTEVKVGEEKTGTVDGVKFTYTAKEDMVVIKMENTTKSAKSVEVSMDLFDLEGKKVSDDTFYYKESIGYLSAGETFYGQVYNFTGTEISKYAVNSLEVTSTYSFCADCFSEIKASPKKGTDTSDVNITLEYTGDASKINKDGITVYGAVVYYDSKDNIVSVDTIIEEIYPSDSKTITVKSYIIGEADHYEVILSGAYYDAASDNPEEPYETDETNKTAKPTPSMEPTDEPEDEE